MAMASYASEYPRRPTKPNSHLAPRRIHAWHGREPEHLTLRWRQASHLRRGVCQSCAHNSWVTLPWAWASAGTHALVDRVKCVVGVAPIVAAGQCLPSFAVVCPRAPQVAPTESMARNGCWRGLASPRWTLRLRLHPDDENQILRRRIRGLSVAYRCRSRPFER